MTWTAKSGKEDKKISLKSFTQIIDLICDLSSAADNKIDKRDCQSILVYKVLKYAYKKAPEEESANGKSDDATNVSNDLTGTETGTPSQMIATNSSQHNVHNLSTTAPNPPLQSVHNVQYPNSALNPPQQHVHNVPYAPLYPIIHPMPQDQQFQSFPQNQPHPYIHPNHPYTQY